MVDDKYIGLTLAVSGSLFIGTSAIVTKKGLMAAGTSAAYGSTASDNLSYMKNPIWWAGMIMLVIGELANFAAYTFAPPILVTPLGALSVLIGAVLASFLLDEKLGHLGRLGCTLSLIGSLIIVLHAPEDKDVTTVDQILEYAMHPGFMLYSFTVTVICLVLVYAVSPRYGRVHPGVYIAICSLSGSVSVMAIKGFGVAVKLTVEGHNQFNRISTYIFGVVTVGCILVQMNYYNKALDTFSVNIVNPMYYVGFSSATIVASLILFQGFNTHDATNTVSLLSGFTVTFLGVHILNLSRVATTPDNAGHNALENGVLNPRLSLQGRTSLDYQPPTPRSAGHTRRTSLSRTQRTTLFDAYDGPEDLRPGESVYLEDLREEDSDDDADERTGLRTGDGTRSKGVPQRSPNGRS